jgi:hypothetical protein
MRLRAKLAVAATAATLTLLTIPGVALAHGHIGNGDLEMTIGFAEEPAYAGLPNGVQLFLVHDGHDVTDLDGTLQVEVTFGDETSEPMTLEPWFEVGEWGTPGEYRAVFTPSQPGEYTFHFTGTVDGEEIDESMTSSPKTFSTVEDIASSEFPAVNAPTTQELADRVDAEAARTQETADAATEAASAANDAADSASSAKTLGLIGLLVGAAGLIVAVIALATRKRGASA